MVLVKSPPRERLRALHTTLHSMPKDTEKIRGLVRKQFPEKKDDEVEEIVRELYVLAEIIYEARQRQKNEPRD